MPLKKDIKNKNSSLSSSDKRGQMLIKIDDLMEKINSEYGPFILDELQKRLEFTIQEFHADLKIVLEDAFDKHANLNKAKEVSSDMDVPSFIAEHQKKRQKK
tara:strand:+ start:962 stop:1267 length:306 start_codon:yes stop_codon:yes gene_type:complete